MAKDKLNFSINNQIKLLDIMSRNKTKPIYQDEYITFYHGDSSQILFELPFGQANAIITDPPYEMGAKKMSWQESIEGHNVLDDIHDKDFGKGFDYEMLEVFNALTSNPNMLFFCNSEQIDEYIKFAKKNKMYFRILEWHKKGNFPVSNLFLFDTEFMVHIFEGMSVAKKPAINTYWIEPVVKKDQFTNHPTPKPEVIMTGLINQLTDKGDTVIEPFSGSGTTAVCCKRLGRKCIAIEIDEQYVDMSIERFKATEANVQQSSLFQFGMIT